MLRYPTCYTPAGNAVLLPIAALFSATLLLSSRDLEPLAFGVTDLI